MISHWDWIKTSKTLYWLLPNYWDCITPNFEIINIYFMPLKKFLTLKTWLIAILQATILLSTWHFWWWTLQVHMSNLFLTCSAIVALSTFTCTFLICIFSSFIICVCVCLCVCVCARMRMCVCLFTQTHWHDQNVIQSHFLKLKLTGLNSEFSFP